MPEDRFGDLGEGAKGRRRAGSEGRTAADRLSRVDEEPAGEAREAGPPEPARPGGRYTWVVGVAALIAIIVATVNSLPNAGRGFRGPSPGSAAPAFAAPSATGDVEGDANVRQRSGGSAEAGARPACDVHGAGIVNVCDLGFRPLVLTFVTTGCEEQLDTVDAIRRDFARVRFVGVFSGDSRDEVAATAAEHGWGFPVAIDPDRQVFNLYRAGDCPTTVLVRRGGKVQATRLGEVAEDDLAAAARELERDAVRGRR